MEKIILILLSFAMICMCINSMLFVKRLTAIESVLWKQQSQLESMLSEQ